VMPAISVMSAIIEGATGVCCIPGWSTMGAAVRATIRERRQHDRGEGEGVMTCEALA
jgi:hypothetical protein